LFGCPEKRAAQNFIKRNFKFESLELLGRMIFWDKMDRLAKRVNA